MDTFKTHCYSIVFLVVCSAVLSLAYPQVRRHQFVIQETPVKRLCKTQNSITVNGMFPGPTLEVTNGDTIEVEVVNKARYNATIHCSWLRATVYGALIIRPREGEAYPFPKPKRETAIILGEWWNANPIDVVREATRTGAAPNNSDAYTINGQPGDLYNCSSQGPGQTTDVLIKGDQPPARYYMAARAYQSAQNAAFDNTTTTAILEYKSAPCPAKKGINAPKPIMPPLPAYNDTNTVTAFSQSFRSLRKAQVPTDIDENLFFTVGLGLNNCPPNFPSSRCQGPNGTRFTASMNNVSFVFPQTVSLLQAHQQGIPGVFTTDFPGTPPLQFDYTGNVSRSLYQPIPGTKLYKLKYGSRVQIVLQDTSIVTPENHPIHLHGYDFYIVAEGFGNFDPKTDTSKFNLIDPPLRNTASVPVNGWAVIRFVADNPGVWIMHCHLDVHITWGLAMAFLVENGVGELQTLQAPPPDLPVC
ncbi:hypothetical protein V6N13_055673 [Hibiscus sabdariffa]